MPSSSEKMKVNPFIISRHQVFSLQLCCKCWSGRAQCCIDLLLAVSDGVDCTPVNQRHYSFRKEQLWFSFPFWGLRCSLQKSFWVVVVAWLWFLGVSMSALCRMTVTLVQSVHIGSKGSFSSDWKDQALPS